MIEVQNLSKSFEDKKRGKIRAVDGITYTCQAGQVYGLLGPNGAGKTTTLRLLSTILRPDAGKATICGFDVQTQSSEVRQRIGFLTGDTGLYRRLTGKEILRYFADLYGMDRADFDRNFDEICHHLKLNDFINTRTDKLSTGQKQRISIARTVIHKPPVLILDEPTAGLDVIASRAIIEFIRQARSAGQTILLSTHVMREAERLCDRIGIIHEGKMLSDGTLADIRRDFKTDDLEDAFLNVLGLNSIPTA